MYKDELLPLDRLIKRSFANQEREQLKEARYQRNRVKFGLYPIAAGIARLQREWESEPSRRLLRTKPALHAWLIGKTVVATDSRGFITGTLLKPSEVAGRELRSKTLALTLRDAGGRLVIHTARSVP